MAATSVLQILIRARDDSSRALRGAQGNLQKLGQVAKIAAVAGVAALAGLGIASVKMAADFEAAMSESIAIMGDVSDAMRDKMGKAAREVALTTTFSAKQAAEAYFFLASAGLDAAQSIEALPKVAAFAQAGAFDMARATDLLTDAQSALGLTVDDTAQNMENMVRVSDILVGANTLANASVEQFSEALTNKAGAALRAVNKDIEEGVAVLAVFADQGIKGSEAGTQLGIVLRDLQTKALKNAPAFAEMGIAVFDAQGNMNNMADIVADLEGALGGMSVAQQKATLLQLGFSDKSVASLQALLGNSAAIREYEVALRDMAGVTDEVAKKQLDNFNAQLSLLKSQFQDLMITVGNKVLPQLTRFTKWLRGEGIPQAKALALTVQRELEPWIQRLRTAFDKLRGPAEEAGGVLIKIIRFLDENREVLAAVAIAIAIVLVPAFVAWAIAAGAAAIATLLAVLPILLVIAAIALLVLGIILLVKHWDTVTAAIVSATGKVWDVITDIFGRVLSFLKDNWKEILSVALLFLTGPGGLVFLFSSNAFGIRDKVVGAFTNMKDWVIDRVIGLKDGAILKFLELVGWVGGLPTKLLDAIGNLAILLFSVGADVIQGLWDGMVLIWDKLTGWLGGIAGTVVDFIKNPLSIRSPSLVMMVIGENIMLGLQKGLERGLLGVEGLMGRLAGTLNISSSFTASAVVATPPQLFAAGAGVGSPRIGGAITVNIGPVNLSGSATQQDADDLVDMVERGLRSRTLRGR